MDEIQKTIEALMNKINEFEKTNKEMYAKMLDINDKILTLSNNDKPIENKEENQDKKDTEIETKEEKTNDEEEIINF